MGKSGKLFKALVTGIKAFKSPSKEKFEKDKSASKGNKDHLKKGNKEKCLWSLGKSSSRNRDTTAAPAAVLDALEIESMQDENKHVKDVHHTGHSITSNPVYECKGPIKAEVASFTGCDPGELVEQEKLAAIKIQAAYRRHLALQQVSRALRGVVRLQALARGQMVRKQASATLRCMQALVKVQALARGYRIRSSELGQLIQKHLQQTRQQRNKPAEGWVSSVATLQQLQAMAQSKQDAVIKRQRALVYAFSEQLNRCTLKQNSSSAKDFQPDKSYWGWVWLERWMAAHPWGNVPGVVGEQPKKEETVNIKAAIEEDAESYNKDVFPLKEPVGNPYIQATPSTDFVGDHISILQESPTTEKEAISSAVKVKEEHMHIPMPVEKVKTEDNSAIETTAIIDSVIKKAAPRSLLSSPPPPPPPPPPPLYAKRANPIVAHITQSHKSQQAAILSNTYSEMPEAVEVSPPTSSARAAELLVDTCTSTLADHLKLSCPNELMPPDCASSPMKDPMPSTSASLPIEAFTTQGTLQSYPESHIQYNQSTSTLLSITPGTNRVSHAESDKANTLIPMASASDSGPASPSQPPPSTTAFTGVLELLPQKHAFVCSSLSIPDFTCVDDMSNPAYEDTGFVIYGDSASTAVEPVHGCNEGNVALNSVENGSVDLKNEPLEADMDIEMPESIFSINHEVVQADSLSEANGGCDTSVMSAGDKLIDASSSKQTSPISKQGPHTEAVSPSVPNYMTTTKSAQAKMRTLTSPAQKSTSPKQKADSPKPRFDVLKQKMDSPKLKLESPKQKLDSPKQKLNSPKQKLDSPKQKPDSTTKRRHSLSALEGKGSLGTLRSSPRVPASSKGQAVSPKDTCAENSHCAKGDSQSYGRPVAV